ncbi:hypothetical protein U1Q18_034274 [Sarracenia purpurea var. burkii]
MSISDGVVNSPEPPQDETSHQPIKAKKLNRYDSLDVESRKLHGHHGHHGSKVVSWSVILHLAFQSLGIVYGDIGTSPLYVFASTFTDGIKHNDDILGVLCLIYYTLTLIPLIKYVLIVLRANDNGDGGFDPKPRGRRSRSFEFSTGVAEQSKSSRVEAQIKARKQSIREVLPPLCHHARHFHGHWRRCSYSLHLW